MVWQESWGLRFGNKFAYQLCNDGNMLYCLWLAMQVSQGISYSSYRLLGLHILLFNFAATLFSFGSCFVFSSWFGLCGNLGSFHFIALLHVLLPHQCSFPSSRIFKRVICLFWDGLVLSSALTYLNDEKKKPCACLMLVRKDLRTKIE